MTRTPMILVLASLTACVAADEEPTVASQQDEVREVQMDCSVNKGAQSFNDVSGLVYGGDPGFEAKVYDWDDLPRRGNPLFAIADALFGGLSEDLSQIVQCQREWRDNPEGKNKIIHGPGTCAAATWTIDGEALGANHNDEGKLQPYTGLFASGTSVKSVVRLSSATNVAKPDAWLMKPVWSIGVKLFPAPADKPDTKVHSVNFVMFNEHGVSGTSSDEMLRPDDDGKYFFTNWLYGDDFAARTLISTLSQFTRPHTHLGEPIAKQTRLQAIDRLATVTQNGAVVAPEAAHYPTVIKLQLADSVAPLADLEDRVDEELSDSWDKDFRKQLLAYEAGELVFDIIADTPGTGPDTLRTAGEEQRIGRLTLSKPVVSDICDLDLTFQHRRLGEIFTGWRPPPSDME